jgi:flagellar biosynthesis/type III secretory pathway chaperone
MKTLLQALELNVEREIDVQKEIQALLDEQLDLLLHGDTKRLATVLATAEQGLEKSRELERERSALIARIAATLGVSSREVSLQMLEERIGSDAAPLAGKGAELKALLARIRERNREVGLLLRHSVLFLDDLVRAVTGHAAGAPTYTSAGTMRSRESGALAAEA